MPGTTKTGVWSEQPAKTSIAPLPPAYTLYGPDSSRADLRQRLNHCDDRLSATEKAGSVKPQPERYMLQAERTPSHARSLSANGVTQKTQLVPLRLGPIVLSDGPQISTPESSSSDAPDLTGNTAKQRPRSDSTQELLEDTRRQSYRETRETPFQRCRRMSTDPSTSTPALPRDATSFQSAPDTARNLKPQASRQALASTFRRQATDTEVMNAPRECPGVSVRPRARLQRKRSDQSAKRPHANLVEQEVFELNSIVEHRRAAAARKDKVDNHVPAVAPAMQVRARTQTLNDIGSAFSRPATAPIPSHADKQLVKHDKRRDSHAPRNTNGAGSRVSGWLTSIMTSSSSNGSPQGNEPFYKCTPPTEGTRPASHTSLCSSSTNLDSPGLTLASSPTATSKGHSRSLTAESRMTPMSPVDDTYDPVDGQKKSEKMWAPITADVGLAL